ncbi:MAG: efflux RND transporter periplasmic adaptor subunit [Verrucomicrobiota bacterium]
MIKQIKVGTVLLALAGFVFSGCSEKKKTDAAPPKMEMQVVAVEAKRQPVAENISLVGNLLANESVEIKSEIDGTIAEINFQEGQRVKKGDLLIRVDESKLAAAAAESEANFKLSELNFARGQQLFKEKLIAQQEFDQMSSQFQINKANLELKRQQLKDARILAPFSGIVGGRNVSPGQVIAKSMTLTWLTDVDPVKVEINVPERFISQLKVGQKIQINVASYPDKKFDGEVYFIAEQVDPTTRTAFVKARIPNPELLLKPGMFANLELTLKIREAAIVIPESALSQLIEGGGAMIFVVDKNSTAQMRKVKLGVRTAGQVEIVNGVEAGEKVIVEGLQKIGPGMRVKFAATEVKPNETSSK